MSRDNNSRRQRGTTMVEMLTVLGILGLFMTLGVALVAPVANAPNKLQAKVDTLQSAAAGFYRLQRDVRMSNIGGDYACTASGTITCTQSYSSLTSTPAIALLTAKSSGQFAYNYTTGSATVGRPTWQGVIVYWLAANTSGGSDVKTAFGQFSSAIQAPATPSPSAVQSAVSLAVSSTSATVAVPNVSQILVDFSPTQHVVGLKLIAVGKVGGRTNETSFESDTYARN